MPVAPEARSTKAGKAEADTRGKTKGKAMADADVGGKMPNRSTCASSCSMAWSVAATAPT